MKSMTVRTAMRNAKGASRQLLRCDPEMYSAGCAIGMLMRSGMSVPRSTTAPSFWLKSFGSRWGLPVTAVGELWCPIPSQCGCLFHAKRGYARVELHASQFQASSSCVAAAARFRKKPMSRPDWGAQVQCLSRLPGLDPTR